MPGVPGQLTWGPWQIYAASVNYEAVLGFGDPAFAASFVGYQIDPASPTGQHGIGGNGPFFSPLDITLVLQAPFGDTWPDPTVQALGGVQVETDAQALTVDAASISEDPGGLGATAALVYTTVAAGDYISGIVAINDTDHRRYIYTITGTARLRQRQSIPNAILPPPPPNQPPTTPPPPTTLPPEVIQRKLLEAANPGFNCEITREERPADLVTLFLGDKISLTVDGIMGNLGIIGRSHVVTRLRFRWQVQHGGDALSESLTTTATLEKIPGTLLGGAGTSSTDQDDTFDGGDLSLFAGWDATGAGWGSGWAA